MDKSISQIAHVELLSPRPDESVAFFVDQLGMQVTARERQSVYLKTWGDFFHHTLVVTEGQISGIAHIGWRATGADQLSAAADRLELSGHGAGWIDDTPGHGPAYRYRTPGGHLHELFWEAERYAAPPELRSVLPARPQRPPRHVSAPRQLDHVTLGTGHMLDDIAFLREKLGTRFMEYTVLQSDAQEPFFAQLSNTEQAHDYALISDSSGIPGRSHHIAFWVDQYVDVVAAAGDLVESGVKIEYGPGRHGHGENTFLYFREPGGHRVELFSGGYRNYQPDWEPVRWVAHEGGADMFKSYPAPDSLLELFPDSEVAAEIMGDGSNPWAVSGVS